MEEREMKKDEVSSPMPDREEGEGVYFGGELSDLEVGCVWGGGDAKV